MPKRSKPRDQEYCLGRGAISMMLHDSDFNIRKQFYEASKREAQFRDLGYANGWADTPSKLERKR